MKTILFACMTLILLGGCSDDTSGPGQTRADYVLLKNAHFPAWSPDGKAIVCNRTLPAYEYCAWRVTANGTYSDTLFCDAAGQYGPWYPKWMPDGHRIVYHRTRSVGGEPVYEFVIRDLQGGNPVVWNVPSFWHDAAFTLSPDGSEVLYSTWKDASWALSLIDGSVRFICDGYGASVSPDGQWLAFTKNDSITVAPFGGGPEATYEPGWDPAWTPDSKYIVFTGMRESSGSDLIIVARDRTYRAQLTDDPEWDLRPMVSPSGDRLAYVKTIDDDYGPFNIRIFDLSSLGLDR